MLMNLQRKLLTALLACTFAGAAHAQTVVFTEDFSSGNAAWQEGPAPFAPLDYVAAGGVDGNGFVFAELSFADLGQGTIFRAQDAADASGDAFTGDWIDAGYTQLSAMVRHNASVPLNYFARIATRTPPISDNFPAALAVTFQPVLPNEWTEITFDVQSDSSQLVSYEGSDYSTVFSDVTNVQLGISVPDGMEASTTPIVFDLDRVSLAVPEPSAICLTVLGICGVLAARIARTGR